MSSSTTISEIPSSYRDYEVEAAEIVKNVIKYAVSVVQSEIKESAQPINWPCGKDFTVDKGKEIIQQLIDSWHIGSSWKCCIDYLNCQNDMHCYAVKYSEPTRRKPVPKATASVYFYVYIHDKESPVLVKFIVEGQRTPHMPEDTVFHEIWLRNVIRNKLAISQAAQITC